MTETMEKSTTTENPILTLREKARLAKEEAERLAWEKYYAMIKEHKASEKDDLKRNLAFLCEAVGGDPETAIWDFGGWQPHMGESRTTASVMVDDVILRVLKTGRRGFYSERKYFAQVQIQPCPHCTGVWMCFDLDYDLLANLGNALNGDGSHDPNCKENDEFTPEDD